MGLFAPGERFFVHPTDTERSHRTIERAEARRPHPPCSAAPRLPPVSLHGDRRRGYSGGHYGRLTFMTEPVPTVLWRISLRVPGKAVPVFEAALAPHCCALLSSVPEGGECRITALAEAEPQTGLLEAQLALAAATRGMAPPALVVEPLPEFDWLAENRERFRPFQIGRFWIAEPGEPAARPAGTIALRIEAATAFGSGRHGSTEGCLLALAAITGRRPQRVLDLGCGSGILAIAAAKLWHRPVLASDIDPLAAAVAQANARLNGVGTLVRAITAPGYDSPVIAAAQPFDLIVCNILARPLKRLARELFCHLAPGGTAVLAGLLRSDGADVLATHRAAGLRLVRRIDIAQWQTLVVRRPGEAASAP